MCYPNTEILCNVFLGEKQMNTEFKGIKLIAISELGISQIYLNEKKIEEIQNGSMWMLLKSIRRYPSMILVMADTL